MNHEKPARDFNLEATVVESNLAYALNAGRLRPEAKSSVCSRSPGKVWLHMHHSDFQHHKA